MSATATNPSAACTWSPSRTSVQKRQSSRGPGKDPLLLHALRAHVDELADGRVDEPGRVVVAVAPPGTIDEDDVLVLALPAAHAELVRERAQTPAAALLHVRRDGIVRRGRGPGPRRVREHVHLRDACPLDGSKR